MTALDEARARRDAAPPPRQIDYDRMNRERPAQKAALTRAVKTKDPERIAEVCRAAVRAWSEIGAWPDDWSRWENALNDALPYWDHVDLRDLR